MSVAGDWRQCPYINPRGSFADSRGFYCRSGAAGTDRRRLLPSVCTFANHAAAPPSPTIIIVRRRLLRQTTATIARRRPLPSETFRFAPSRPPPIHMAMGGHGFREGTACRLPRQPPRQPPRRPPRRPPRQHHTPPPLRQLSRSDTSPTTLPTNQLAPPEGPQRGRNRVVPNRFGIHPS